MDSNVFHNIYNNLQLFYKNHISKNVVEAEDPLNINSIFLQNLEPLFSEPKTLIIPSINLKAPVVEVGVEEDGTMQTPPDWVSVGWFNDSANPSQQDLMILNGHYDNNYGGPAVFYMLKNVSIGDKVSVLDDNNKFHTYVVVDSFFIDIKDPSRTEVFANFNEGTSTLVIITCGGVWDSVEHTYNKRLVVRAEYLD